MSRDFNARNARLMRRQMSLERALTKQPNDDNLIYKRLYLLSKIMQRMHLSEENHDNNFYKIEAKLNLMNVIPLNNGGARIATTCLFPDWDSVYVIVEKYKDGYIVHDAGKTMDVLADIDCLEDKHLSIIQNQCKMNGAEFLNGQIRAKISKEEDLSWINSSIIAVANSASVGVRLAQNA